jgi:hypothetical protein
MRRGGGGWGGGGERERERGREREGKSVWCDKIKRERDGGFTLVPAPALWGQRNLACMCCTVGPQW